MRPLLVVALLALAACGRHDPVRQNICMENDRVAQYWENMKATRQLKRYEQDMLDYSHEQLQYYECL